MECCQCQGIEELFNEETVSRNLADYRKNGPDKVTRILVNALIAAGVKGKTLLDIGGGVGAIQHELLAAGMDNAIDVDASSAYLKAAQNEAGRRDIAEKIQFMHGNFVDLAAKLPASDVVTLNRVICCYDDVVGLVNSSVERAKQLYALVYPHNAWWLKLGMKILNFLFKIQDNPYRAFDHPTQAVENLIEKHNLHRIFYRRTLVWQVAVYSR